MLDFLQYVPWWLSVAVVVIVLGVVAWFWSVLVNIASTVSGPIYYLVTSFSAFLVLAFGMSMPKFWQMVVFPMPDILKGGFGMLAVLCAVLAIVNVVLTQGASQKAILQITLVLTVIVGFGFGVAAGIMYGMGQLPFFMVAPTIYAFVLMVAMAIVSIHNAWQKNPMQPERVSG
ncbi:MAG: hypothetical protein AAB734_01165 [Patescibacteria group bacterium]